MFPPQQITRNPLTKDAEVFDLRRSVICSPTLCLLVLAICIVRLVSHWTAGTCDWNLCGWRRVRSGYVARRSTATLARLYRIGRRVYGPATKIRTRRTMPSLPVGRDQTANRRSLFKRQRGSRTLTAASSLEPLGKPASVYLSW